MELPQYRSHLLLDPRYMVYPDLAQNENVIEMIWGKMRRANPRIFHCNEVCARLVHKIDPFFLAVSLQLDHRS